MTTPKTEKLTVWNVINDLSQGKKDLIRNAEDVPAAWKVYNPFLVNRGFSFFADTIMLAAHLNRYPDIPHDMQYDFYMKEIRPKKRFHKWPTKKNSTTLDTVSQVYGINKERAWEYLSLLDQDQLNQIMKYNNKGGT